eukprot:jgi/Picsp_1/2580/NSC_00811-R1_dolichyl-diphosphooligosaccharide--protein glycosyltransferase subunit dad1
MIGALTRLPIGEIRKTLANKYTKTPIKIKVLDAFAATALTTALLQFLYALLVGSFPFNAFLAGFFSCIGSFVLTLCLRLQISEGYVASKSQERAFVDYVLAMTTLFLAAWCYIG